MIERFLCNQFGPSRVLIFNSTKNEDSREQNIRTALGFARLPTGGGSADVARSVRGDATGFAEGLDG
jgi:hypothetical protein